MWSGPVGLGAIRTRIGRPSRRGEAHRPSIVAGAMPGARHRPSGVPMIELPTAECGGPEHGHLRRQRLQPERPVRPVPDGRDRTATGPDEGYNTIVRLNDPALFTEEAQRNPVISEFLDAPFSVSYVAAQEQLPRGGVVHPQAAPGDGRSRSRASWARVDGLPVTTADRDVRHQPRRDAGEVDHARPDHRGRRPGRPDDPQGARTPRR